MRKSFVQNPIYHFLGPTIFSLAYYAVGIENTVSKSCPAALGNKVFVFHGPHRDISLPLESGMAPMATQPLEIREVSMGQELPR